MSNTKCVFSNTDGTLSRLVDFDFSGLTEIIKYPVGFNTQIADGARNPDAMGGFLGRKEHDWWGLAAVMQLFQPAEVKFASKWSAWSDRVRDGQLL